MKEYVTVDDLDEINEKYNPQYVLLISARNDGKSYAAKYKALRDAIGGKLFCYLRRYEIDLKRVDPVQYWADFLGFDNVIEKLTGGKWSEITADKTGFYLCNRDEKGKEIRGPLVGYIHALSVSRSYKSMAYPTVENILYEEFVTDAGYLYNEPAKLQQYVSTIFRRRTGRVYLIGNTISRISPYYKQWQLTGVEKMEPGQLDVYDMDVTENVEEPYTVRLIVYRPNVTGKKNKGKSGMFFGKSAGMITGQQWDSHDQPQLKDKRAMYVERYRLIFDSDANAKFTMILLQHAQNRNYVTWYVEPFEGEIPEGARIVGPWPVESPYWTKDFQPIVPQEAALFRWIRLGHVVYSDNLTGTEFKRALRQVRVPDTGTD